MDMNMNNIVSLIAHHMECLKPACSETLLDSRCGQKFVEKVFDLVVRCPFFDFTRGYCVFKDFIKIHIFIRQFWVMVVDRNKALKIKSKYQHCKEMYPFSNGIFVKNYTLHKMKTAKSEKKTEANCMGRHCSSQQYNTLKASDWIGKQSNQDWIFEFHCFSDKRIF